MRKIKLAPLIISLLIFTACGRQATPTAVPTPRETVTDTPEPTAPTPEPTEDPELAEERERLEALAAATRAIEPLLAPDIDASAFLRWFGERHLFGGVPRPADWDDAPGYLREMSGRSLRVLEDEFRGLDTDPELARAAGVFFLDGNDSGTTTLAFGGDVNLIEGSYVMPTYRANGNSLEAVLTGGLLDEMRAADVLLLGNEFSYSERGFPTPGKQFTFRAPPANAQIFRDMGTDVAFLANNHVADYGEDALSDTLAALDSVGLARIGAGMDIEEASKTVYIIVNGLKIAYVGAGCIERYSVFTPGAGEGTPGIFRADEVQSELLMRRIGEAAEQSDYVTVSLHWGIESTIELEAYQRELGQMCIDAGADAVIGSHPHVLQGAEFYNGKPIIYSTGNFWFSTTHNDTVLLELILDGSGSARVKFLPCLTSGGITRLTHGDEAARIFDYYESISFGITVDENGFIEAGG